MFARKKDKARAFLWDTQELVLQLPFNSRYQLGTIVAIDSSKKHPKLRSFGSLSTLFGTSQDAVDAYQYLEESVCTVEPLQSLEQFARASAESTSDLEIAVKFISASLEGSSLQGSDVAISSPAFFSRGIKGKNLLSSQSGLRCFGD